MQIILFVHRNRVKRTLPQCLPSFHLRAGILEYFQRDFYANEKYQNKAHSAKKKMYKKREREGKRGGGSSVIVKNNFSSKSFVLEPIAGIFGIYFIIGL